MLGEGTACDDDDDDDDWRDLCTSWPSIDSVASVHLKKKYNKNNNKYKKLSSKFAIGSHAFDVPSAGIFFAEHSMLFFDYLLQCLIF